MKKKAVTYRATLPDGLEVTKKSFNVDQPEALLGCFLRNGVWMYSSITATPQDWGVQIFVKAVRI